MTLVRSATRGMMFLMLALISLPLAVYATGQMQMTGIAGVVTGLGLLGFHLIGLAFGGVPAQPARRIKAKVRPRHTYPVRSMSVTRRWMEEDLTWNQVSKTRPGSAPRSSNYSSTGNRFR